jgi:hypothetical protein
MKAHLTKQGRIIIIADTITEGYALKCLNGDCSPESRMMFDFSILGFPVPASPIMSGPIAVSLTKYNTVKIVAGTITEAFALKYFQTEPRPVPSESSTLLFDLSILEEPAPSIVPDTTPSAIPVRPTVYYGAGDE